MNSPSNIIRFDRPLQDRLASFKRSKPRPAPPRYLEKNGPMGVAIYRGTPQRRLALIREFRSTRPDLWRGTGLHNETWRKHATRAYPDTIGWGGADRDTLYTSTPRAFMRFTGYCDDVVSSINHRGWFTDDDEHEKARGVVYQLPARSGMPRYLAGIQEPHNITSFALDFYETPESAARAADSLAEDFAEECREGAEESERSREIADNEHDAEKLRQRIRVLAYSIRVGHAHPAEIMQAASLHLSKLRKDLRELNHATSQLKSA